MDIDRFLEETRQEILDHGFAVQYDDRRSKIYKNLPRAFTAGRTLWGRPELMIVGPFTEEQMTTMLTQAIEVDDATPLKPGDVITTTRPLKAVEADPSAFITAQATFGILTGLQLLWADADGHFPGEPQPTRPKGVLPINAPDPYGPPDPFDEETP